MTFEQGAPPRLRNVTVPACLAPDARLNADAEGLARADITLSGGRIASITSVKPGDAEPGDADCDGGMVWPCPVDLHTHLDKGHIWPRRANPDGTFKGALDAVTADRAANWSAEDVAARMDFSLRCAYAHGTSAIRTHLDSAPPQHAISWPVFAKMRDAWAGRIDLQAVALFSIDRALDAGELEEIAKTAAAHGGILGPVTYPIDRLDEALDNAFAAAAAHNLDIDCHVDETQDPSSRTLMNLAEATLRHGYQGRVVAGHCCSLGVQGSSAAARIIEEVADAGIAVVSLPLCNMYLQDRHRQGWNGRFDDEANDAVGATRTPRWRGVTALHELKAADVPVAVASDNTRDPFYAYGDLDLVEVFREAVRTLHLDHPLGRWPCAVATTPADIMGLADHGRIAVDGSADLVLFSARDWSEFLARPQSDRVVLRGGRPIDTPLPDYRELDALVRA